MLHSSKGLNLTFGYIFYDTDLNDFLLYFLTRCKIQCRYGDTKKFVNQAKVADAVDFLMIFLIVSCEKGLIVGLENIP